MTFPVWVPPSGAVDGVVLLWRRGAGQCHIDGGDGRPACGARAKPPAGVEPGAKVYICKTCRVESNGVEGEQPSAPTPTTEALAQGCDEEGCAAGYCVTFRDSRYPGGWAHLCAKHFNEYQPNPDDIKKLPPLVRRRKRRKKSE